MGKFIDMTGQRIGRLMVVHLANERAGNRPQWICVCDCGNVVTVRSNALQTGHTKSCGCLKIDVATMMLSTHGLSQTKTYSTWEHMIGRCFNRNYKRYADYGGRGIRVCERWLSFENFLADMGERPEERTLDRIDNNGDYCPENCRWATSQEQAFNKRSNQRVEIDGQLVTVTEAAELIGMSYEVFRSRLRRGWSVADAISRPVIPRK